MSTCSECGQEIPHKPLRPKHARWVRQFAAANPTLDAWAVAQQMRFTVEQVREALEGEE